MTRILTAVSLCVLLAAGTAAAQSTSSPGNAVGGASGTTRPGAVDGTSGPTGGTGGKVDPKTTGSTSSQPTMPTNHCDPAQAEKSGAATNQNNASGGCTK